MPEANSTLVELWQPGGLAPLGHGVLVGPRLMLTAVVATGQPASAHAELLVRPVGTDPTRYRARIAGQAEHFALVDIDDPAWMPPAVRPVRWGAFTSTESWIESTILADPVLEVEINRLAAPAAGLWQPRLARSVAATQLSVTIAPPLGSPTVCGPFLVGVVVRTPGDGAGRLEVASLDAIATDPTLRSIVERHTGRPVWFEPVELGRVVRPWFMDHPPVVPSALLQSQRAVVPFRGRLSTIDRLLRWCRSDAPASGLLVAGPAGQGKRRLAREIAYRLGPGWTAGELAVGPTPSWVDTVAQLRQPLLLIVDDGPARGDQLRALAAHASAGRIRGTLRVLVLGPDTGDWWTRLLDSAADLHALFDVPVERLGAAEPTLMDEEDHIAASVEALAATPLLGRSGVRVSASYRPLSTVGSAGGDGQCGRLQLQALATVLNGMSAIDRDPADIVREHEEIAWDRAALQLPSVARSSWRRALAAALLFGARTETVARQVAQAAMGRHGSVPATTVEEVVSWIRVLYPPSDASARYWGTIGPHEVRHRLLADICADPELWETLLPTVESAQASQAMSIILAVGARRSDSTLTDRLRAIVVGHPRQHAPALIDVATVDTAAAALVDDLLASPAVELDELLAESMLERIPDDAGPLTNARHTLHKALIDSYSGPAFNRSALAHQLSRYATILATEGDAAKAADLCRQAVEQYGWLANNGANPAAFVSPLAACLRLLAGLEAADGRFADAASSAADAAEILRELATNSDPRARSHYAETVELTAQYAAAAGLTEEAVHACRTAVEIRRELAVDLTGRAALARTLARLADMLWTQAAFDDSLAVRLDAVATGRQVHRVDPGAYGDDLLTNLHILAEHQHARGLTEPAVQTQREVVELTRHRVDDGDTARLIALGAASLQLADWLAQAGQADRAVQAARDSVEWLAGRPDDPATARMVAAGHGDLGRWLAAIGRWDEALAQTTQATQRLRRLVDGGDVRSAVPLASALINETAALLDCGRPSEAATTGDEALRLLATPDIGGNEPRLWAAALTNQALALRALGRHDDSLSMLERAAQLQRQSATGPVEERVRTLAALRDTLSEADRPHEAVGVAAEVAAIYDASPSPADQLGRARALVAHAECLKDERRWDDAVVVATRAEQLFDNLPAASGEALLDRVKVALLMSTCLQAMGRTAQAEQAAAAAMARYRAAADARGFDNATEFADALDVVSGLPGLDADTALSFAEEVVTRRTTLARDGDPVEVTALADALRRLAQRRHDAGQGGAGVDAARRAVETSQRLRDLGVGTATEEIARSEQTLGWHLQATAREPADWYEAADAAARSAANYHNLVEKEPERHGAALARSLVDLSHRQAYLGDWAAALASARDAVAAAENTRRPDADVLVGAFDQLEHVLVMVGTEPDRTAVAERRVEFLRRAER